MKRVFNKTVSFCIFLFIALWIVAPSLNAYAEENGEYILKIIAENEYSDAVRFGDGYLLLKDGTFDNITSKTTYTFIDENGNKREIKNDIGFTEIYLNTSGSSYYVDYGALAVGKDNKVALMDINGDLYGGDTNFYECVIYAGDNMFYTTNATADQEDKANTKIWTLRRKDGSVVREFTNLDFYSQRVHSNGYEYIMDNDRGESELLVINSEGNITSLGKGYYGYTVYGDLGYIEGRKASESGNGSLISIFYEDGRKAFELDDCYYIDLYGLKEFGYGRVSLSGEENYSENLVDINGNYIFDLDKYYTISGYDNDQAIAIDINENIYLVDYSDNVIFDVDKFAKGFGESYKAITFSSYYIDDTLTVTLVDESKPESNGISFFFDNNGNELLGNVNGEIRGFNGTYATLYDRVDESNGVISKDGSFEKRGYEYLSLQSDPNESDIVAIADNSSTGSKIMIMKDGQDIDKYDWIGSREWPWKQFIKGHALVKVKGEEEYGIIDIHGNEIIPTGQYTNFIQYDESECILAYKDGIPYLFDTNGNILNTSGEYKNIGDYVTTFYKFRAGRNYTEYKDYIKSNNISIVRDYNDKLGLIQVVSSNDNNYDIDGNGIVDIKDLAEIALSYNKTNNSDGWNSRLDLNKDNIIDIYDLILISKVL